MSCCRKNKNIAIDKEEYEELKEYLQEEIKDFKIVDYMSENNEHKTYVEVEFEEYILELDDLNKKDITLDLVIDSIIKNHMR